MNRKAVGICAVAAIGVSAVWLAGYLLPALSLGILAFLAEEGDDWTLLKILAPCFLLAFGLLELRLYHRLPVEGDPTQERRVWSRVCLIGFCVCFLVGVYQDFHGWRDLDQAPYVSEGVLPLMEQMEEEKPDFSVQLPVAGDLDGFVMTNRGVLSPASLILRQDGQDGEWYHIFYREFVGQPLAEAWAESRIQEALGRGASPRQEGEALYWWDESMEAEVLLYQRDKRVVQVTYAGPKALLPCQDAWQEALFPGEKI